MWAVEKRQIAYSAFVDHFLPGDEAPHLFNRGRVTYRTESQSDTVTPHAQASSVQHRQRASSVGHRWNQRFQLGSWQLFAKPFDSTH